MNTEGTDEASRVGVVGGSPFHAVRRSTPHQRVVLHTVVEEIDGRAITATGEVLNLDAYSRFKYGDQAQAHLYADELTGVILESPIAQQYASGPPIVVSASAYKRLLTAAQFVADGVLLRLKWAGFDAEAGRVHRARLTEGDYGTMNAAERAFWMTNNGLSLDDKLFYGRHVIIVDDVRITGSHENAIARLFQALPVASVTSAYVVAIEPGLAARDTRIEDRMNHASINTLHDLYQLMWDEEHYVLTARTVKFVLSRPLDVLEVFLRKLEGTDLRALHMGMLDDGYYAMSAYVEGSQILLSEVARRKAHATDAASRSAKLDREAHAWLEWDPTNGDPESPVPDLLQITRPVPRITSQKGRSRGNV
jgi:hypothetical protein